MSMVRFVPFLLAASLAGGCSDPPATPSAKTDGGSVAAGSSSVFDPGAIAAGDSVAGLVVVHRDVQRVFGDSAWSGTVRFSGELTLDGVYQRHFDYPEPEELCFHVLGRSAERVPRFAPDAFTSPGMKTWFCFTNRERALELMGDAAPPREATVIVDDYQVVRQFTDAYATARLVGVTRLGDSTRNTLRDPR